MSKEDMAARENEQKEYTEREAAELLKEQEHMTHDTAVKLVAQEAAQRAATKAAAGLSTGRLHFVRPSIFLDPVEDSLSHFILRLALCAQERWRKWLERAEGLYMKVLLQSHRASILANSGLTVRPVDWTSPENIRRARDWVLPENLERVNLAEGKKHVDVLEGVQGTPSAAQPSGARASLEPHYMVPFTEVPRLVARRKVVVDQGYAYVPQKHLDSYILNQYQIMLAKGLSESVRVRAALMEPEEDRVLGFLDHLVTDSGLLDGFGATQEIEAQYGSLDPNQIHALAESHWPPCMRHMDKTLSQEHHLKHFARVYYTLFLKSMGLSMEQSVEWWKQNMTLKGPDASKSGGFEKSRYGYNIRHLYGKEGKRKSLTAYGCSKIIDGPAPGPSTGQAHGCPFRHWNEANLKAMLGQPIPHPAPPPKDHALFEKEAPMVRVPDQKVNEIATKAKDGFYTAACHDYYLATHPEPPLQIEESLFGHPNGYAKASLAYVQRRKDFFEGKLTEAGIPVRTAEPDVNQMLADDYVMPSESAPRLHRELRRVSTSPAKQDSAPAPSEGPAEEPSTMLED
eukprot:NODE_749_length_1812_cov_22.809983_g609_i0.p1 GENE.NODE_749_length_1812_cov_22.809983_g609_i0~~NODE_749_length_1812_cov_22.809983_g609_i0.p1  ORF type:complete len:579 (+),score=135.78 NODE_749_length_1812_cov_22.809983_g609_i0:29-1738(+)